MSFKMFAPQNYVPYRDLVLIRIIQESKIIGSNLAAPESSESGKRYKIVAVGPTVTKDGPKVGDYVFVIGTWGQDVAYLPATKEYCITPEKNVALCVGKDQ